jgi:hypothetical protein
MIDLGVLGANPDGYAFKKLKAIDDLRKMIAID